MPYVLATLHSASHDEMMAAPPVIASEAVARKSAAKIAGGKRGHLLETASICSMARWKARNAWLISSSRTACEPCVVIGTPLVIWVWPVVKIVSADLAKEDLALHVKSRPGLDQTRHHLQLGASVVFGNCIVQYFGERWRTDGTLSTELPVASSPDQDHIRSRSVPA